MAVAAAAAAAVVLRVGVGGVVVVVAAVVVEVEVEVEAAAAAAVEVEVEVVIESDFHIGICCGVTGFGYGSGMERVWNGYGSGYGSGHAIWAGFPAMAVKEESGVFLVWSSSTRARQSRNRRNCNHSATIEVQEAPSRNRTDLTSLQGALAVLLVASQLVAFVQLPEALGGSEPAPAAGAGPAAEATAVAAAPRRKMTSSGSSSSSSTEAAEAAEAAVEATVAATGVAVQGPEAVLG